MLSHNINPVDGENIPEEKQVYASAMLKSIKSTHQRKPEPPRKVPDEIRNTPDELNEIKGRNPIFQKNNNFPNREIEKPNLIRAKYFRSPKNSLKNGTSKGVTLNEEFDIEGLLDGRGEFKKKKKVTNKGAENTEFFQKEIKKKTIKEQVNNQNPEYLKALKENVKKTKDNSSNHQGKASKDHDQLEEGIVIDQENQNQADKNSNNDINTIKGKMKDFYEKMLEEKIQFKGDENTLNNKSEFKDAHQTTNAPEGENENKSFNKGDSFRNRIIKKQNPCLLPSNEVK